MYTGAKANGMEDEQCVKVAMRKMPVGVCVCGVCVCVCVCVCVWCVCVCVCLCVCVTLCVCVCDTVCRYVMYMCLRKIDQT
jgi:hypothetical protein